MGPCGEAHNIRYGRPGLNRMSVLLLRVPLWTAQKHESPRLAGQSRKKTSVERMSQMCRVSPNVADVRTVHAHSRRPASGGRSRRPPASTGNRPAEPSTSRRCRPDSAPRRALSGGSTPPDARPASGARPAPASRRGPRPTPHPSCRSDSSLPAVPERANLGCRQAARRRQRPPRLPPGAQDRRRGQRRRVDPSGAPPQLRVSALRPGRAAGGDFATRRPLRHCRHRGGSTGSRFGP